MTDVVDLKSYTHAAASQLLVVIDLQDFYCERLRSEHGIAIERSLENCRAAIRHARKVGIPLAYTRLSCETSANWIEGFEPKRSDMVFDRTRPSCYACPYFEEVVSQVGHYTIAGLMAEATCVATAIEASHRHHTVTFLDDASVSSGQDRIAPLSAHRLTTDMLTLFAQPITTRQWITATSGRGMQGRNYG